MRRVSITDKLIIASLFLSVVTILIVASYSFYNAKDAILDRSFNQLNSVRTIKANLIENIFSHCSQEVQLAKSSSEVINILEKINKNETKPYYSALKGGIDLKSESFIQELSKNYYNEIFIIGNNKLIFKIKENKEVNNKSDADYDSLWINTIVKESIFIKDFSTLDTISPVFITLSSKIIDKQGNPLGVIVFEVSSNSINSAMLNSPSDGLGISGESYLVGADYLMRSSSRFQENSVLKTMVQTEAVDSAFINGSGAKVIKDYRGISVLSSYDKVSIPNLDWVIISEIDYTEVTIPIYKIRNEIIFISIFIFVIVLIVIVIISRRITFPIQKLNQAALEVGAGNLDVEIHTKSDDEIGELTETFNQMVEKLRFQTTELASERSKSLRSLINGQESERQRLSRELHDSLGQLLIGLKLKYESCLNQAKPKSSGFVELGFLFDQTIEETRRISNNLMPAALSEFGLTTAVRNTCNELSETSCINIKYTVKGTSKLLSDEIKTYLFRIIQEALTNIIKHSKADAADINLNFEEQLVLITIEDNGVGFDQIETKSLKSNGLNNINDRVSLLSGKFVIDSEPYKGTKLSIEIPISTENNG